MERVALASDNCRSHRIHTGLAVFNVWVFFNVWVIFLLAGVVSANLVSVIRRAWTRTHAFFAANVESCFGSMVCHSSGNVG